MILPTQQELAKLPHLFQVRYALYAATSVSYLTTLPEAATCLKVVGDYLDGKASKEDCKVTATAASYAAAAVAAAAYDAAAVASANAAAHAAGAAAADADAATRAAFYAAFHAAYAAAVAAFIAADAKLDLAKDLRRYYKELLNFDAISESYLLGV